VKRASNVVSRVIIKGMKVPFFRSIEASSYRSQIPNFFENLALMVKSGIPLNEALEVLAAETRSSGFKKILQRIKAQIEEGTSFSDAMEKYRYVFGDLSVNIVKAGEVNGTLEDNIRYVASLLQRQQELKQKIQTALIYPEIVLVLAVVIGGGISIFILPRLVPLFTSLNVKLPLLTRILLTVSSFLQKNGIYVAIGAIALIIIYILLSRVKPIKLFLHTVALRMPLIGKILRDYQLALFSQVFGALFRSGLTIQDSLEATGDAVTNFRYKRVLMNARKRLSAGVPLSVILDKDPRFFPQQTIALLSVGEKSGKLDESFDYLAVFYDREVETAARRLPTIMEPMLLFIIALIVLFIALAIIMPIYEITSGVTLRS